MNEKRNLMIGFDLGRRESQICYYDKSAKDAVSAAVRTGSSQYTFPTSLSRSVKKDVWHFGPEANYFAEQQGELLIDRLFALCMKKEPVVLGNETWEPAKLLEIFIRKSLELLQISEPQEQIRSIVVTVPKLNKAFVSNLKTVYREMGISEKRGFMQDYDESFFYHTMYQKPDIWSRKVGLFGFADGGVDFAGLSVSTKTRPALVEVAHREKAMLPQEKKQWDEAFVKIIEEAFGTDIYSSVFLVGDGFSPEEMPKSVNMLCRSQRRVFHGSNLFGKGAAFAAKEKADEREIIGYLFSGADLVHNNIGMEMLVNGAPAYYPLIVAGVNWYEAHKECELILDETSSLTFVVSSMEDKERRKFSMELPGLPERPNRTTRLQMKLEYEAVSRCRVTVTDLGFGELFPASGLVWQESMEV